MATCCRTTKIPAAISRQWTIAEIVGWALSTTIVLFVPKCPACLAAHLAIWTGLGVSFSMASYLRWGLLILCGGSLIYLASQWSRRSMILVLTSFGRVTSGAGLSAPGESASLEQKGGTLPGRCIDR